MAPDRSGTRRWWYDWSEPGGIFANGMLVALAGLVGALLERWL